MGIIPFNSTTSLVDVWDIHSVEVDIYSNDQLDPPGEHVGIDINSMKSVAYVPWLLCNIFIIEKKTNEAWISYNSSSKI